MTKIEETIIRFIIDYYRKNQFYPNYDEIADGVSKAKATVHVYMKELEDKGIIVRKSDRSSQYRLINMDFICKHGSMESCSSGGEERIGGPRYKLTHPNDWDIVDTKEKNGLVVYSMRSHDMASAICALLNEGKITVEQLHREMYHSTEAFDDLIKRKMELQSCYAGIREQIDGMMKHICDGLCKYPIMLSDQDDLDDVCAECELGGYTCRLLNLLERMDTGSGGR